MGAQTGGAAGDEWLSPGPDPCSPRVCARSCVCVCVCVCCLSATGGLEPETGSGVHVWGSECSSPCPKRTWILETTGQGLAALSPITTTEPPAHLPPGVDPDLA